MENKQVVTIGIEFMHEKGLIPEAAFELQGTVEQVQKQLAALMVYSDQVNKIVIGAGAMATLMQSALNRGMEL